MFKYSDFKLNTYFYLITLDFNKTNVADIKKCFIVRKHKNLVDVKYLNQDSKFTSFLFGIEKTKLLDITGVDLCIPEFIYNAVHNIPNPELTPEQTLQTLFLTGYPELDAIIRKAKVKKSLNAYYI